MLSRAQRTAVVGPRTCDHTARHCVQDEQMSDPEIVNNLSGDDVDPGLIIAGGRRARRGRATFGNARGYQAKQQAESDEDSW